ncbi:peptidase C14, caspase domain-containing protein, partial [Desarmillaria tabescens]
IWAFLVGIDGYSSNPLHGCVEDASRVERYLVHHLHIPTGQIQKLLGHHDAPPTDISSIPSCENILSTLLGLSTNSDIEHGDPIIIFFAGHGSRYLWSDNHEDKEKFVEAFCPMDRNTLNRNGKPISDITNQEINTILSEISHTKGHRISVILDCCHAGSIT